MVLHQLLNCVTYVNKFLISHNWVNRKPHPPRFGRKIPDELRPVVFVTHMEHHSNHTSWLETVAKVESILPDSRGFINLDYLEKLLAKYKHRKTRIASVTACSNVSGIQTCYKDVAKVMHENGGLCFVDFACSAPYVASDPRGK